ncbi:MAG: alkaline phosphatase family protein, partial [Nannocystaceae bacterium]
TTTDVEGPEFAQMGFRVPSVVVGPYVRQGCVVSDVLEHASIAATATAKWGLPPLNDRAAAATDLSVCIDPSLFGKPTPPKKLRTLTLSKSQIMAEVGKTTSQDELFEALGIELPLPPDVDKRYRKGVLKLLARAEKLGVVKLRS